MFSRFDRNIQHPNFTGSDKSAVQTAQRAYLAATSVLLKSEVFLPETGSVPYSHFSNTLEAYFASPETLNESSWFVDSGATNHIISNHNNLSFHSQYPGTEKVAVGNGKKLSIKHIGFSHLPTQTKPISTLSLPTVLHFPAMTKNLISVSEITKENKVVAEFYADSCLIKDKETGTVLLHGQLRNELYQLALASASSRSSSYLSSSVPVSHSTSASVSITENTSSY